MATVSKKDIERLSGLYADRLTRNVRYSVEEMEELIGSDVWAGGVRRAQAVSEKPDQGKGV